MGLGLKRFIKSIVQKLPPNPYCNVINFKNSLGKSKNRIKFDEEKCMYTLADGMESIHICRRERRKRYKRGITAAINELAHVYFLDRLQLGPNDTLIDCGANVGELGVWAKFHKINYIAIEPEELEAACCDLNSYAGNKLTNRVALWDETKELRFFSKPASADSSLIEIEGAQSVTTIQAYRLDELIKSSTLKGTVVLKIEAEGAEPEALIGATNLLPHVHYVTVDCGYERGSKQDHTFVEVNNILGNAKFLAKFANLKKRITVMYERSA